MSENPFTHEDREAVALLRAVMSYNTPLGKAAKSWKVHDLLDRVQREVEAAPPPPPPAGWYLWDDVEAVYYPGTGHRLFRRSDMPWGSVWSSIQYEEFNRLTVLRLDGQEGSES